VRVSRSLEKVEARSFADERFRGTNDFLRIKIPACMSYSLHLCRYTLRWPTIYDDEMPLNVGCCTMRARLVLANASLSFCVFTQIMVLRQREDLLVKERIFFITEEIATAMKGEVGYPTTGLLPCMLTKAKLVSTD
jgi:hypothetical protein